MTRDVDAAALSRAGATLRAARRGRGDPVARSGSLFDELDAPKTAPAPRPVRPRRASGAELRDDGIARAERSSGTEWQDAALSFVLRFASMYAKLTCDDVRLHAERVGLPRPPDSRAWGAVMLRARRLGAIAPTDRFVPSADPACHKSPARVWRRC